MYMIRSMKERERENREKMKKMGVREFSTNVNNDTYTQTQIA